MFAATKACRAALPSRIRFVSSSGDLSSARTHQSARNPSQSTPNNWSSSSLSPAYPRDSGVRPPRSLSKSSLTFSKRSNSTVSPPSRRSCAASNNCVVNKASVDVVFGLRRRSTVLAGSPVSGEPTTMGFWPRARLVVRRLSTVPAFTFTFFSNSVSTNAAAAGAASLISTCCELSLSATVDLIVTSCEVSPSETGDLRAAVRELVLQIAKPAASRAAMTRHSIRSMVLPPCCRRLA